MGLGDHLSGLVREMRRARLQLVRDLECQCCAPGCGLIQSSRCNSICAFREIEGGGRNFSSAWLHRVVDDELLDGSSRYHKPSANPYMSKSAVSNELANLTFFDSHSSSRLFDG
jgi:hypothetical protein